MILIRNWRESWRFFSMQAFALAGAIQTTWLSVPAEQQALVPVEWVMYATVLCVALGAIGRVTIQPRV
jgi:hypothetical protein